MSDERLLEIIEKNDKYYILGFIKGFKANYEILTEENQELKEKLKATNKGLKKIILKRKKWKHRYQLAKHEIKELEKQLEEKDTLVKQCELSVANVMDCYCERTDCSGRIKDSKQYDSLVQKVENQQKDFIEYLENEINKFKELEKFAREVFGNNKIINIGLAQKTIEENNLLISNFNIILSKYKEINHIADVGKMVGGKDEK